MGTLKIIQKMALVLTFMLGLCFSASAQTGGLSVTKESDGKYHVYFKSSSTGSFVIAPDAAITIVSPTGTWMPAGITTVNSPGNSWGFGNSKYTTGGNDYISFVPTNDPTSAMSYVANTAVELFNFTNTGACSNGSLNIYNGIELLSPSSVSYATTLVVYNTSTDLAREAFDGTAFNQNTALCQPLSPSLNCAGINLSPNSFTFGTPSTASLTVSLSNITAGSYTFSETTAVSFATNPVTYSTSLANNDSSATIPISYDGTGSVGTPQTLTFSIAGNGASTATCTVTATINNATCSANAGTLN